LVIPARRRTGWGMGSFAIGKTMDELRSLPRERGEDAGRQMRGSESLQPWRRPSSGPSGHLLPASGEKGKR
jgi:hypothetical protein